MQVLMYEKAKQELLAKMFNRYPKNKGCFMISGRKFLLLLFIAVFVQHDNTCLANEKTDIIIDPIFFIEPDMMKGMQSLGGAAYLAGQWLGSFFNGNDPSKLLTKFFEVMKNINPTKTSEEIYYQEFIAPALLYSFLIGEKTSDETLKIFSDYIYKNKSHGFNPELMKLCAEMTFDPEKNTNVMRIIPKAVSILEKLRDNRCTIHIVGNWNDALFTRLEKKFPKEFKHINGQKIISGSSKKAKRELYKNFFTTHAPEKTIVIEPYPLIAQYLKRSYPHLAIIESKNSSPRDVQKALKHHGALS